MKRRSWVCTHASLSAIDPGTRVLLARRLDTAVLQVVSRELVALSREEGPFIPHMDISSWEEKCPFLPAFPSAAGNLPAPKLVTTVTLPPEAPTPSPLFFLHTPSAESLTLDD